jgi:hypothetical protein
MQKNFWVVVVFALFFSILACTPPAEVTQISCKPVEAEKVVRCWNPKADLAKKVEPRYYVGDNLSESVPAEITSARVKFTLTVSGPGEARLSVVTPDGQAATVSATSGQPGELSTDVQLTRVPVLNASDRSETGRYTVYFDVTIEPVGGKKVQGVILNLEASGLIQ